MYISIVYFRFVYCNKVQDKSTGERQNNNSEDLYILLFYLSDVHVIMSNLHLNYMVLGD